MALSRSSFASALRRGLAGEPRVSVQQPGCPDSGPVPRAALWGEQVTIEVEVGPDATRVVINGELDLVTMPMFAEQLSRLTRKNPGRLVFDLTGVGFMDCGSARLIARTGCSLPDGHRPVIRHPNPGVRMVFELTGLDAFCEIEA